MTSRDDDRIEVDFGRAAVDYARYRAGFPDDTVLRPARLAGTFVTGIHPLWFEDLSKTGFGEIECFGFDIYAPYSHEAWIGRIRTSAYVGASLPADAVQTFSDTHRALLARDFPNDPLQVPHRVFAVTGKIAIIVAIGPSHRRLRAISGLAASFPAGKHRRLKCPALIGVLR